MSKPTGRETLYVGPRLYLEGFSNDFIAELKEACTRDNPKWFQWEALARAKPWMRRKLSNPNPRYLYSYEETAKGLYVLRGYRTRLLARFPQTKVVDLRVAPKARVPLILADKSMIPDDYQIAARDAAILAENCFLEAPTGAGKTFIAFLIAIALGLKTLFLVNTDVLAQQTAEEARRILGIEPGLIKGDINRLEDFTIASIQSLATGRIDAMAKDWGLVIQDEGHLAAADTFQLVLSKFYAKYIIGLSGTPDDRGDKLGWIIYQGIGPKAWSISSKELVKRGRIMGVQIQYHHSTAFNKKKRKYDPMQKTEHLQDLCDCNERNDEICDDLEDLLRQGHNVVAFTELVDHAIWIHQEMERRMPSIKPTLYYGTMKPDSVKKKAYADLKANKSRLSITTYKAAGTGLDVKPWTDIYFMSPMKAPALIKQTIGRGRRIANGKTRCVVHDLIDDNDETLLKKAASRKQAYATL